MKVTIELDNVEVSAGNTTEVFDWSKVDKDALAAFVAQAAMIGVAKAGNDSASGAKAYAEKHEVDVEDARKELIGSWIQARYESGKFDRRSGDGLSAVKKKAIQAVRTAVKAQDEAKYKAMEERERFAAMIEYFESLDDAKQDGLIKWAEAEIKRAEAAKEALAGLDIAL